MKAVLTSLLFFVATSLVVSAQQAPVHIRIVAPELPPLVTKDNQGKIIGLFVESLAEAEQFSHLSFEIEIVPWARAMQLANNNHVDAIMPVLFTQERAKLLDYPKEELINFYGSVIIKRATDDFIFQGFDKLSTVKRIAKVRAVSLGREFERAKSNPLIKINEVSKLEDALNMLLLQRVDLVVSDSLVADEVITVIDKHDDFAIMPISDTKEPSYLAFSKQFSQQYDINAIMKLINQYNNPDYYQTKLVKK